jgi:nitroimidazol reductase NimA-like FMN-containing flavoprotein (pyridoxamine 5'-phosphate oxidase superfamily)
MTRNTAPEPSPLARVRRMADRARYDTAAVYEVLDAAAFCHVATVRDGRPVVLPMVHARIGDTVVLHGSPAAGLFRDVRGGSAVCLTATLLDGLVLARSARNHSVNYRSVTVHGRAVAVTDAEEFRGGGSRCAGLCRPSSATRHCGGSLSRTPRSRPAAGRQSSLSPTSACRSGQERCRPAWSSASLFPPRVCPPQ